jgi:hypothetical protein
MGSDARYVIRNVIATTHSCSAFRRFSAQWSYIKSIIAINVQHLSSIDFFSHNDMDMMEVGNGALTLAEQRTHFAAWIFLKSPILLGTDVSINFGVHNYWLDLHFVVLDEQTLQSTTCYYQERRATGIPPRQHRWWSSCSVHGESRCPNNISS